MEPEHRATQGSATASVIIERRIEWSDLDAGGRFKTHVVSRLVEAAETVLFERLRMVDLIPRLPRVHLEADFPKPLQYPDIVAVALRVDRVGDGSITYRFEFRQNADICVTGTSTAALLDEAGDRPSSWDSHVRKTLLESGPQRPELLTR